MSIRVLHTSGTVWARLVGGALAVAFVVASWASAAASPAAAATTLPPSMRLHGADRYETAVAVSRMAFEHGSQSAVLVNGSSYADAMAAAPAAGVLHAPVLPVQAGSVPAAVSAELVRLGVTTVLVIGGPKAVGDAVVGQLQRAGLTVARAHGADRYETAAAVARHVVSREVQGPELLLASGEGFADALVGGAQGSATGQALLLTPRTSLSPATASVVADLRPRSITVVGGSGVIDDGVLTELARYTSAPITRLDGADRFGTAAAVQARLWARAPAVLLATGQTFPDAIAAGALGVPVLMTQASCMPAETASLLERWGTTTVIAVGGTAAISDGAAERKVCDTP